MTGINAHNTDDDITTSIKGDLSGLTEANNIEIKTENGVVTLYGFADSLEQNSFILRIAKGTTNVKDVISYLKILPKESVLRKPH